MPQTIVEKIAQSHMAEGPDRPLRAGDFLSIRPHHVMTHDNTSAVMKKFKAIGAERVTIPKQPVFTADHDIQNTDESNLAKYRGMEKFAREHGIDFYPPGTGIGHQIMVEQGYVLPGTFVVASDSHSNMYGALGAIGTPVVRTDCRSDLGHGRVLVADSAHHPGRARRQACAGRHRQRRHHHPLWPLQPRGSAERRRRIHRAGCGFAQHGRPSEHRQHDHRVGRAGGLVPGGRRHAELS